MRGLFWVLGLFALAVAVSLGAQLNEGYVLFVFPKWLRMEVSFNLFVVAIVLLFITAYLLVRLISLTLGLPARARQYRAQKAQENSRELFLDAVRLLFEGRFGQALRKADEAQALGFAPGLSALLAARAAQRMREDAKQRGWLRRATVDDPRTEAAAMMLEAEMLIETRDFDDALEVLRRLQEKHGRHLAALRLELRARQGAGDWEAVLRLARVLEKRKALPPELTQKIVLDAHMAALRQRDGDARSVLNYLEKVPKDERGLRLVAAAARQLYALGAHDAAAALIEEQFGDGDDGLSWSEELVGLYGKLTSGNLTARLGRAEKWLRHRPRDAALLLALGRLCVGQRLWGKAQSYLEASLSVQSTTAAHLALAQLFDSLERVEEANRHFRLSVELGG